MTSTTTQAIISTRCSRNEKLSQHEGKDTFAYVSYVLIHSEYLVSCKIAVEGCCHGQLDAIYTSIASLEARNNYNVSVLLICGDFQAIRNEGDLMCMSVPDKYKELGEFWK